MDRPYRTSLLVDLAGGFLVTAGVVWASIVASVVGGHAGVLWRGAAGLLIVYTVARLLTLWQPWLPPLLVVVTALTMPLHGSGGTYPSGLQFGPLAYSNATAAFYVVATAAAVALGVRAPWRRVRGGGLLLAVAFAAVVALSGSLAATVLLVLVPGAAMLARPRQRRAFLAVGAAALMAAVAATLWLAAMYRPGAPTPRLQTAERLLTDKRLVLWHEGLVLAASHPTTGVGPARFRQLSPTARGDVDAVAAHNEYLQAAAELGWPGAVLLISLAWWAYLRLLTGRLDRGTAVAGAALTAVMIQASIDYILHAPAVPLALAALVGTGPRRACMAVRPASEPGPPDHQGSPLRSAIRRYMSIEWAATRR